MKLRLTPLNIVSSILLINIAEILLFNKKIGLNSLNITSLIVLLILCFLSDQVFRRLIPEQKRIWLFELVFLIFVVILITLIRIFF